MLPLPSGRSGRKLGGLHGGPAGERGIPGGRGPSQAPAPAQNQVGLRVARCGRFMGSKGRQLHVPATCTWGGMRISGVVSPSPNYGEVE
jgi:hypothetical protein